MLNKMFERVQDKITLEEMWGTRRDPLNYLPVELAELVLLCLPFRDLMYVPFPPLPYLIQYAFIGSNWWSR